MFFFFLQFTKIWILRGSYLVSAKTFQLNMSQAQKTKKTSCSHFKTLVSLSQANTSLKLDVQLRMINVKSICGQIPIWAQRQHQREYKVKTIHSGSWWGLPVFALAEYGEAKKLYIFISFSLRFFYFSKTKIALGWKGRELNTVKLSLLMHRFTRVVINMQYVER